MTLTDILPRLRKTLPDPLSTNLWPAFTQATTDEPIVAEVSMNRLVELCGTPCVHTADAVVPGSGGRRSTVDIATVLCVSVIAVSTTTASVRALIIDTCRTRCRRDGTRRDSSDEPPRGAVGRRESCHAPR